MILSSFINYQPLQYQDYVFPFSANVLGILFAFSSASMIPIVGIYNWYYQPGKNCLEVRNLTIFFYYYTYIKFIF